MSYKGDFRAGDVIDLKFQTLNVSAVPTTLAGTPGISVYKANSTTESTTGITLTVDFDSRTGLNHVRITTVSDGTFYAEANDFDVVITAGTVNSVSVVGRVVASFSLANRSALRPSTKTRNLNVGSDGVGEANAVQILGTAVSTPATAGIIDVNLINIAGAAVDTTASQLGVKVNSQANIDFGAAQKTSLNAATPAATLSGTPDVNVTKFGGTSVTGRDLGASVLISPGTGTGQLDVTSGVVKANLVQILATALTETAGQIAGGFKKFFNVAAPTSTCLSINQTGDAFALVGTAGAGLTALGDTRIAHLDADVSSRLAPAGTLATVTTCTNLTNAPTSGDLTATMKASVTTAAPTASAIAAAVSTHQPSSETYAADGSVPTIEQLLLMIHSELSQFGVSGTTITCKKLDGTTTSMVFTTDSATAPTTRTRTS